MGKYPKILVINLQSVFANNATAITLQSILSSWPKDCLMEIQASSQEVQIPAEFKGMQSLFLPASTFPFKAAANLKTLKKTNNLLKQGQASAAASDRNKKTNTKETLRQCLFAASDLSVMHVGKRIKADVLDFNPDIIYTLGSSVAVMKLAVYFSKLLNIHILLHFMDNWQECLQWQDNKLLLPYKRAMDRWLDKTYKRSAHVLTISPKMAHAYTEHRGIEHTALMNSINVDAMTCKDKLSSEPFTFVYTGGLHLSRWKALVEVSQAIKNVATTLHASVRLNIYTGKANCEQYKAKFNSDFVEFFDYVPHDEIKSVYEQADVLLHAEFENPQMNGYFKYSISTKVPEYLAANRPVLFYGPRSMYLYEYLEQAHAAYVTSNTAELEGAVIALVTDSQLRARLAQSANALACRNHSKTKAERVFYEAVQGSIPKNMVEDK